jgi:hypothetical protein
MYTNQERIEQGTKKQIPFTWIAAVDLSSTDYTAPAGVVIGEMRTNTAGTIKISLTSIDGLTTTSVAAPYTAFDIDRSNITKIWKTGTDGALDTGCITVRGWYVTEIL